MQPPTHTPNQQHPHVCPLPTLCLQLSRKAIASRGTLQQLNRNVDPRRGGHEDGGGHMKLRNFSVQHQQTHRSNVVPFTEKQKGKQEQNLPGLLHLPTAFVILVVRGQTWLEPTRHFPTSSTPLVPTVLPQHADPERRSPVTCRIQPPEGKLSLLQNNSIQACAQGSRHPSAQRNRARVRLTARQGLVSIHPLGG